MSRRVYWAIIVVSVLALFLVIVTIIPSWIVPLPTGAELENMSPQDRSDAVDSRLDLQNGVRVAMFQGLSAIFFLISALFTVRQLQQSQRQFQLSEEQVRLDRSIARMDQEVAAQAQLTEQYARAIDLISSDRLAARLGGIASLEQLAIQSASHRSAVIDVLETFIRHDSPLPHSAQDDDITSVPNLRTRRSDVQAALNVVSHLPATPSDTTGVELSHVDLRKADLTGANLHRANLSQSDLRGADLQGANLGESDLRGADLREATIRETNFTQARFDQHTRFPNNLNPRDLGAITELRGS